MMDDLIRRSMEAERDIPFDESAWDELSDRLDREKRSFPLPFWWLLACLLLGLLMGSSIYYLSKQLNSAIKRIETLEAQYHHTPLVKTDTCTEIVNIYHYDTLYRTIIIEKIHDQHIDKQPVQSLPYQRFTPPISSSIDAFTQPETNSLYWLDRLKPAPIGSRSSKPAPYSKNVNFQKPKKLSFEVGFVHASSHLSFSNFEKQRRDLENMSTLESAQFNGLRIAYGFSPKLKISITPGIEKIDFQSFDKFPSSYLEAPITNYETDSMAIQQQTWRMPIKVRYIPITKFRWQPFVETGLIAQARTKALVQTKYVTTLPYIQPSYSAENELTFEALKINQLTFGLGLTYYFNHNINLQFSGQYNTQIKPDDLLRMKYAFQGQLGYRF